MDKLIRASAVGLIFFFVLIGLQIGARIDERAALLLAGAFIGGLVVALASAPVLLILARRPRAEQWIRQPAGEYQIAPSWQPAELPPPRSVSLPNLRQVQPNRYLVRQQIAEDAMMIYRTLYPGTPPTRENVRQACGIVSNAHISAALDWLHDEAGIVSEGMQGRERTWTQ